ncbi:MAG: glycosyltransferase family 39 protein, partial [Acidobacteriota bacterium]
CPGADELEVGHGCDIKLRSMNRGFFSRSLFHETAIIIYLALLKLGFNVLFHGQYGYFRDELYYIACSDHLAWGYVDQPPLSIFILAATRRLLGDSLHAIRFSAALAGAAVVFLAGLMARKLGGGKYAQFLAALAAAVSPVILANGARYFSMNAFDLLFWALAMYLVILIVKDDRPRLWLAFGAVVGLGLLNKYSVLFLGLGLVAGLLLTVRRKHLLNKWFWLGGLIALLIFLPHLIWEIQHDFPSLEFMRRASAEKNVEMTLGGFLVGQFMHVGFIQYMICLLGLSYFFFDREGKKYRFLGWTYVAIFSVMFGATQNPTI